MRPTPAEREWLKRHRFQIELDARDWNKELYVTALQLMEMSPHMREWLQGQPKVWISDSNVDCLFNMAHPDNTERLARHLALQTLGA